MSEADQSVVAVLDLVRRTRHAETALAQIVEHWRRLPHTDKQMVGEYAPQVTDAIIRATSGRE